MIDEPKSMKEIHDIMEDLHKKRAKELALKYGLKIENVGRLVPK